MKTSSTPPPHVLIFPFPAQGHINPMLKLAELLALAGLKVTFVNSVHNHNPMVRFTDVWVRFSKYPGFEFKTVPDGLPDDHPRTGDTSFSDIADGVVLAAKPVLRELLLLEIKPSVIIGDGAFDFVVDMGNEVEIPVILFLVAAAHCLWIGYTIPYLIEAKKIPIRGDEDMNGLVKLVPGMESFLRFRDLPGFCRPDVLKQILKDGTGVRKLFLLTFSPKTQKGSRASAFILKPFEALEGPTLLSHIRTKCPKIFSIGPLHAHLRTRVSNQSDHVSSLESSSSSSSLRKVDRSCMSWLDQQEAQSVVYVSFGSITVMTKEQLVEVWFGLVNSKTRFLWVMRPDFVIGDGEDDVPVELREWTKERGYTVDWAPQEEVLAHSAIGSFFTHSGWNSILESLVEGIPMICWPYSGDHQVNSRFVGEVWKLGFDMKDVCDIKVVEKMVNDLMKVKREEFVKSARKMAKLARESVEAGGSSYCNLDSLVEEIRRMNSKNYDQNHM